MNRIGSGKNEQTQKTSGRSLFCRKSFDLRQKKNATAFFIATAGLVLAQVLDPDTAQRIAGTIAGLVP